VAVREQKALENFDKVLNMAADQMLAHERKAAEIETAQRLRTERFEREQRKFLGGKRDEALCRDAWRKSKYDTAQRVAALQLEHQAQKVVEKEQLRLRALREREARFNNKSEINRLKHERRSQSVTATLMEQQSLRGEQEANREHAEQARSGAYLESVQNHRAQLALRGAQKDQEIKRKREKVRSLEEHKVHRVMQQSENKMSQFLHNQLEKQRREDMVQGMRKENALRNAEKRQYVASKAEQRRLELKEQLTMQEEIMQRAAAKKEEDHAMCVEKQLLRQEQARKSQERLRRMEENRLDCLLAKVQKDDERVQIMQEERQREQEMVRRIKRSSLLKQKAIRDGVGQKLEGKKRAAKNRASSSMSKEATSPSQGGVEEDGRKLEGNSAASPVAASPENDEDEVYSADEDQS